LVINKFFCIKKNIGRLAWLDPEVEEWAEMELEKF